VELQGRVKELQEQGLGLVAISYDPPETLADFSRRRGITFPLLSDAGSATIKRYGLLNPLPEDAQGPNKDDPAVAAEVRKYVSVVRPSAAMIGIAFPGTFILDRRGRVTSRFFEDFYIERNTVSNLMMKIGGKAESVAATKVSTGQLELTTYPSDPAVAPGNRFSLGVAIEPHARIHIYAPGATGYRVIGLTIAPQPFVRMLSMQYPRSETYFFKPLNQRVPVYQKPFTLVQEVVLEGTPAAQAALRGKDALTLTGTLEYQACDDKQCFNPASVPLSWTLTLRPLVTERPARPPQERP
jgi:peroxiredoxin